MPITSQSLAVSRAKSIAVVQGDSRPNRVGCRYSTTGAAAQIDISTTLRCRL